VCSRRRASARGWRPAVRRLSGGRSSVRLARNTRPSGAPAPPASQAVHQPAERSRRAYLEVSERRGVSGPSHVDSAPRSAARRSARSRMTSGAFRTREPRQKASRLRSYTCAGADSATPACRPRSCCC
jgi:hypothetical protein